MVGTNLAEYQVQSKQVKRKEDIHWEIKELLPIPSSPTLPYLAVGNIHI